PVRNDETKDKLWKIGDRREVVYAPDELNRSRPNRSCQKAEMRQPPKNEAKTRAGKRAKRNTSPRPGRLAHRCHLSLEYPRSSAARRRTVLPTAYDGRKSNRRYAKNEAVADVPVV